MLMLIDNYDSFSYNLYQLAGSMVSDIRVVRNDEITVDEILAAAPSHVILSPGPGYPKDAGVCIEAALRLGGKIPLLGVCLGHQAICQAYGAEIVRAKELMHGKQDRIRIDNRCRIFKGLSDETDAARYHSLIASRESIPSCLEIIAEDKNGEVMAVRHREMEIYGLQFHPESILSTDGERILKNFLAI